MIWRIVRATGKGDEAVKLKLQHIKAAHLLLLLHPFIADEHHAELRFGHRLMAQISHPEHEGRLSVKVADDHALLLKTIRAVGREKLMKINPVITAMPNMPTMISTVETT
jgi:hypothetical protein